MTNKKNFSSRKYLRAFLRAEKLQSLLPYNDKKNFDAIVIKNASEEFQITEEELKQYIDSLKLVKTYKITPNKLIIMRYA